MYTIVYILKYQPKMYEKKKKSGVYLWYKEFKKVSYIFLNFLMKREV